MGKMKDLHIQQMNDVMETEEWFEYLRDQEDERGGGRGLDPISHHLDLDRKHSRPPPRLEDWARNSSRLLLNMRRDAPTTRSGPPPSTLLDRVARVAGVMERLLPARIVEEDLGDALEDIHRRIERGDPAWQIYRRAFSAIAWACFNSILLALTARVRKGA